MELGPSSQLNPKRQHFAAPQSAAVFAALLGLFGVMAAGYVGRLTPVTLTIDGESRVLRTNQTTVEGVLREAGLSLYPEDSVQPALHASLAAHGTISIVHARPVTILADGQAISVRTHAATLANLFGEQGISIQPNDALAIDDEPANAASSFSDGPTVPHTVSVKRAVTLTVSFDDGSALTLHTTQPTVGQALHAAGVDIYLADRLAPEASAPITANARVSVERSTPVAVQVDGQTIRTRTHSKRVGDVLAELGVSLQGQDTTQPALDAPVQVDLVVRVVRVSEAFLIEQEPVAYETQVLPNPNMEIDTRQVMQDGAAGVLQKRIRVHYEDGQEVSRQVEDRILIRAPQPKIINYGTQIVVRALQTPEGPREYWRHFRVLATSYSASTAGVPKTNPHYGKTALGWTMRKGIVAVDPDVIAYRTEMYVPGYGIGVAGDTGGAIIGKHIDLGYDDDNLVIWYRWVDVYLLTPAPPASQIEYNLPNWPIERGR